MSEFYWRVYTTPFNEQLLFMRNYGMSNALSDQRANEENKPISERALCLLWLRGGNLRDLHKIYRHAEKRLVRSQKSYGSFLSLLKYAKHLMKLQTERKNGCYKFFIGYNKPPVL